MRTLDEFRLAREFLHTHGIDPGRLVGLSDKAWSDMIALAMEWDAERKQPVPEVTLSDEEQEQKDKLEKEQARKEEEALLYHSCGG